MHRILLIFSSSRKAFGMASASALMLTSCSLVLLLSPLLTRFLNHCFCAGALPSCISSALVTPIHKKGCTLDAANYRPTAVGEPLYRLYTIILNRRLVGWSEEHQLRSQVQAGFRPGHSPIKHLFALRHFIDSACISQRPSVCLLCGPPKGL